MSGHESNEGQPVRFSAVGAANWSDLMELFGTRGCRDGCWCMRWRLMRRQFEERKGDRNRELLRSGIESGRYSGILAYVNDQPVGWCSVGPREQFPMLAVSELLAPIDDQPVWSLTCFFVKHAYRRRGMTTRLIEAAVQYAGARGATVVEAYPVVPKLARMPVASGWTGFESAFVAAGFDEVARRNDFRPVMRLMVEHS